MIKLPYKSKLRNYLFQHSVKDYVYEKMLSRTAFDTVIRAQPNVHTTL